MSSPLSIFRRHQKALLAVFGVLIMITFTVGSAVTGYLGSRGGYAGGTETVLTWKHGKLTEQELASMRNAHNLTVRFLDAVVARTIENGGTPKGPGLTRDQRGSIIDPGIPRSFAEEDLVRTMLLARKARDMGMRISDEAIFQFLDTLSDDVIPPGQYGEILSSATGGQFVKLQLFDRLRTELLAQNMRIMAGSGLFSMAPGVAWDYFNRLNRRVKIEALPLRVEEFTDRVSGQPSEVQINQLYEDGRDRYPDPNGPEPGFKRRRKIAFEYLKADFEDFLERQMGSITDAQVAEYYEENKSDFKQIELPPAEEEPVEDATMPGDDAAAGPEDEPPPAAAEMDEAPADEPSQDAAPEPKPAAESPRPSSAPETPKEKPETTTAKPAPAEDKPAEETETPGQPGVDLQPPANEPPTEPGDSVPESPPADAPEKPADQQPKEEPAGDAPKKPAGDAPAPKGQNDAPPEEPADPKPKPEPADAREPKSDADPDETDDPSGSTMTRQFATPTFVSFNAQEGEETPPADADAPPADDNAGAPPADTSQGDGAEESDPPADSAEDSRKPANTEDAAAEKPAPAEQTEAEPKPAAESATDEPAGETDVGEEKITYKPLEEVADEIRRNLARPVAQEAMDEALRTARSEIEGYFKDRIRWEALSSEDPELEKPVPPDTEALADQLGLVAGQTPLVDELEIEDYELGKAYQFSFAGGQMARVSFAEIAFNSDLPLYKTDQIKSFEVDVEFLYWKVDEKEPFVPELKDIQDEVVAFWKRQQAFSVARDEAEKLAAKAAGDKPLGESLEAQQAREVIESDEFAWLTRGPMPSGFGAPRLSSVDGIESPGNDFMESVFRLDVGETGVAVNAPQTVAYVVRVVSESPDEEQRRQQFLSGGVSFETYFVAMAERQRFLQQWFEQLEDEMQVDWERQPDEMPQYD